jgi:hypothetical protein
MEQKSKNRYPSLVPLKSILVFSMIVAVLWMSSAFEDRNNFSESPGNHDKIAGDSVGSIKAFMKVYSVLMSPRCMNCHPSGDAPLQGEDSHVHTMNVVRGKDGTGVYAAKCSNCHQPTNVSGLHTPPGNPKWQLPPENMKMVFQGKTPRQLALQIMNYNQNGHRNKTQLLEHSKDTLVKAAWNMGEGRTPPPMSYTAFVSVWETWIKKGGYAPKQ